MKLVRITSLRILVNMSLALLLFTSACGQSNKTKESSSVEEQSKVAAPEIDINAAVLTNNIEAVKQHIEAGTDINTKDPMSGSTPLITAASFGKTKIAKILIDAKADMSSKNNDGATALHSAAFFCRVEIVQLLIDANADTTAKNNFGATPRESVLGAYSDMKPIYEMLQQQLAPMGMEIDLNEIEKTRPVIAMMLQ